MIHLPHLETDITTACQLSCVACNHSVPLWRRRGPMTADPVQVEADLTRLARIAHADRWGALGGEPLLHHRLVDILRIARVSGVADRIEVWSNGLLLQRQRPDFWRAFDVLVLSVYPGKHDAASLEWITRKCGDEGIELVAKDERHAPNFRTMLEPRPTEPEATATKFARCFFRAFSRVANAGYFFTCCCAPHLPTLVQGRTYGADGVPIAGLDEQTLGEYLSRSEPLGCCTICAGRDTAVPITWREERDPERWVAASAGVAQ
jgi:hypothetical protein